MAGECNPPKAKASPKKLQRAVKDLDRERALIRTMWEMDLWEEAGRRLECLLATFPSSELDWRDYYRFAWILARCHKWIEVVEVARSHLDMVHEPAPRICLKHVELKAMSYLDGREEEVLSGIALLRGLLSSQEGDAVSLTASDIWTPSVDLQMIKESLTQIEAAITRKNGRPIQEFTKSSEISTKSLLVDLRILMQRQAFVECLQEIQRYTFGKITLSSSIVG